jgi:hypothetical protein
VSLAIMLERMVLFCHYRGPPFWIQPKKLKLNPLNTFQKYKRVPEQLMTKESLVLYQFLKHDLRVTLDNFLNLVPSRWTRNSEDCMIIKYCEKLRFYGESFPRLPQLLPDEIGLFSLGPFCAS